MTVLIYASFPAKHTLSVLPFFTSKRLTQPPDAPCAVLAGLPGYTLALKNTDNL